MSTRRAIVNWLVVVASILCASCASAPPWTNGEYLRRYVFWGVPQETHPSDAYKLFPYHTVKNGYAAFHFAPAPTPLPRFVEYRDGDATERVELASLLQSTGTHAFIVVRDDKLLYEGYFNGYQRDSVCMSRSVAKSFTSALVGIAISEGSIKSVDDPIVSYLPELKGRGFDPITIRQLLMMQSGIYYRIAPLPWDEDALAFFYPDIRALLLNDMTIAEPPGQSFHYTDYNTLLLGMIVERSTHRTPSEYLEEKIWKPIGMEYPATWSVDSADNGLELMHVALNARAIDYAKFGRLYLNHGNWNGQQIIPAQWVSDSTRVDPKAANLPWETYDWWPAHGGYYKYQWWGFRQGSDDYSYMAFGRYGQFIFVYPRTKVVIVRTGSKLGIEPQFWPDIFQYIAGHMSEAERPGLNHD